jgi:dTDP-3-amino-3,4,6-trideoxy-alpha-D-glucose transaminase
LSKESAGIPFNDLRPLLRETKGEWKAALARLFERSQFILGEELAAFEREFAAEISAPYAIGVSTGTSAIELCLRAAGLYGSGSETLTTPLTAPFTGLAILSAGCKPRFADIDPETLLLSPEDAAARATRRTAAVMPVHLYGQPCDLPAFSRLASELDAVLAQDACQAHGAECGGRPFTAFSPYVAYSFYPTKNLGCLGDGGAVATNRKAVAGKIRLLRDGARSKGHVSLEPALNARLDELQAAFLRIFLRRLRGGNEQRRRLAACYGEALRDCPGISLVRHTAGSVYHLFVVRAQRRERLREYLAQHGVQTGVHYPVPLHLQPAFEDCGLKRGDLPHAERACREIVSLPMRPGLTESDVTRVSGIIRAFYASRRGM